MVLLIVIGEMVADRPRIIKILNKLDPSTFPTAMSFSFFKAAGILVTSSGQEVPIAIMVNPTRLSLIPN